MVRTGNKYIDTCVIILTLPAAFLFWIIVIIRHFLYDTGILYSCLPETKTVSFGNITAGGTGKTPAVTEAVSELISTGVRPLVISRGYGRKSSGRIRVAKNMSPEECGEEPLTIFNKTGADVICDSDRSAAISDLGEKYDIILLDDAFQHRKVSKHTDIVLIDEKRFLGNKLMMPSGILRDPVSRLRYADIIIISKVNDIDSAQLKKKAGFLKRYCKNIYFSKIVPVNISNGYEKFSIEELADKKLSLFCGLGEPAYFFDIFFENNIVGKKEFRDHYGYGHSAWKILNDISAGADLLITTYKDFVKIPPEKIKELNIYFLDIKTVYYEPGGSICNIGNLIRDTQK